MIPEIDLSGILPPVAVDMLGGGVTDGELITLEESL
jgi:hypothetical protein